MDRQTHCTGQRTVEKRFILCLGMQEVSNPLTFQGGIQGSNIQNDADRDVIFTLSQCPQVASAVGNLDTQQSECLQDVSVTATLIGLPGLIQAGKENQVDLKIPRSLSSCDGFTEEVNSNVP